MDWQDWRAKVMKVCMKGVVRELMPVELIVEWGEEK